MTTISTRVRTFTAATALALAVAAFTVGGADAKPKRPADNGVRCAISGSALSSNPDGEDTVFFLPYDTIVVLDAQGEPHNLVCGPDGRWHVRTPAIRAGASLPTAPAAVTTR